MRASLFCDTSDMIPSNILVNPKGQIKACDFGVLVNSITVTFDLYECECFHPSLDIIHAGVTDIDMLAVMYSPGAFKGPNYTVKYDVAWRLFGRARTRSVLVP